MKLVAPHGCLAIALYNDQGLKSRLWRRIKRRYNQMPRLLRPAFVATLAAPKELARGALMVARGQGRSFLDSFIEPNARGMNRLIDWVDWIGGYPFEVCSTQALQRFAEQHGFDAQIRLDVGPRWGCNEYLLTRLTP